MIERVSADFLIIGSGIAGLRAAAELVAHGRVLILTKSDPGAGSTGYAQGGIAAAVGPLDTPEQHLADTIAAGAGLVDETAARILCYEAPARIRDLMFDNLTVGGKRIQAADFFQTNEFVEGLIFRQKDGR